MNGLYPIATGILAGAAMATLSALAQHAPSARMVQAWTSHQQRRAQSAQCTRARSLPPPSPPTLVTERERCASQPDLRVSAEDLGQTAPSSGPVPSSRSSLVESLVASGPVEA